MALYQQGSHVRQIQDPAFDQILHPGVPAPRPGIYRCTGCGDEIAIAGDHRLPPQNHHQHGLLGGEIRWQLLVYAQQKQ